MAVTPAEFLGAKGHYLSLEPLLTDQDGWITAIAVTLEGINGGENGRRRSTRTNYRMLASVKDLRATLPVAWIAVPQDGSIEHVNIFHPRDICPFVGTKLPYICWGTSESAWRAVAVENRTLTNFLEAARQILAHANFDSRAR
jgi:hypothetical protein